MARNRKMFARIAVQIGDHPETHDQSSWECSAEENSEEYDLPVEECHTTRCVAGWAIHFWAVDEGRDMSLPLSAHADAYHAAHPGLRRVHFPLTWYSSAAADILGLESHEAEYLFSAFRDGDEAYDQVVQYANGEL